MKYALIDGEICSKPRDQDTFWPLSLDEAQHVVDVMNAHEAKTGAEKLEAIAALVASVQNDHPLERT